MNLSPTAKPETPVPLTMADLLAWNKQYVAAAKATPEHSDTQMHNLRLNVIEVAEESLDRCQKAHDQYGENHLVKDWMMNLFGMPQMVTMRDTDGKALGTLPAVELLNAQEVAGGEDASNS